MRGIFWLLLVSVFSAAALFWLFFADSVPPDPVPARPAETATAQPDPVIPPPEISAPPEDASAAARFIGRFGFYPVHGAAAGRRQPVHADDLAAAALAALDCDTAAGRSYALGGGETLAYRDMIGRIFDVLDRPRRIVRTPLLPVMLDVAGAVLPGSELTGDVARRMNMDLDFDDGSAARDFGYAPRGFLSGGRADLFGDRDQS